MTNNTKRIGITTRIVNAQGYEERRDALSQDWVKFLLQKELLIRLQIVRRCLMKILAGGKHHFKLLKRLRVLLHLI